jgi:glutamate dehydrogenase/leucine dehydrogenase
VVTPELAASLRCEVVAPAANIPYAEGAYDALAARGILALPDFVWNAGGVHLYAGPAGEDPESCLSRVERAVAEQTACVFDAAAATGETPMAAALQLAREFLARAAEATASAGAVRPLGHGAARAQGSSPASPR